MSGEVKPLALTADLPIRKEKNKRQHKIAESCLEERVIWRATCSVRSKKYKMLNGSPDIYLGSSKKVHVWETLTYWNFRVNIVFLNGSLFRHTADREQHLVQHSNNHLSFSSVFGLNQFLRGISGFIAAKCSASR